MTPDSTHDWTVCRELEDSVEGLKVPLGDAMSSLLSEQQRSTGGQLIAAYSSLQDHISRSILPSLNLAIVTRLVYKLAATEPMHKGTGQTLLDTLRCNSISPAGNPRSHPRRREQL